MRLLPSSTPQLLHVRAFSACGDSFPQLGVGRASRGFTDEPVADIVQCGEPAFLRSNKINYLRGTWLAALLSFVPSVLCDAQAALDDVCNWLSRSHSPRARITYPASQPLTRRFTCFLFGLTCPECSLRVLIFPDNREMVTFWLGDLND